MKFVTIIKDNFNKIPLELKRLFKRVVLVIACWMLLYHLVLKPIHIPDYWLTKQTALATAKLVTAFMNPSVVKEQGDVSVIFMDDKKVLGVADGCNALDLYILYVGFLICVPTTVKRALLFASIGFLVIFILNVFRCYAIFWLVLYKPGWFEIAHHYVFTMIMYAIIFYAWILYIKKYYSLNVN